MSVWTLLGGGLGTVLAAARPPNVVVILADDLGWSDMQLYDGWLETPRLARMAREGMLFTDFHANSSVCSPTRTAFMTGRYQQRVGIVDVIVGSREPESGLPAGAPTLPRTFQENGYATALFGKRHVGYQDNYNPVHFGFDEFIGLLNGGADYHRHGSWRNGTKRAEVTGYSTDLITDLSVDFMKRNRQKPFFLYVSHQAVHNPYQTRADTPEKRPKEWRQHAVSEANRPRYAEILADLDASVGKVLDTIAELGLAEDTMVFFWSDNGDVPMSPKERPLRGRKFSQYEGGHRVPAIAWWPGKIKPSTKSKALLAGFDLFPTFADVAGIADDAPDNLDGISFKDHLLDGKAMPERDLFFGYEPKLGTTMRRGNWKMILKGDDAQLFDLDKDLKETTNVVNENPEVTTQMRKAIETFKRTVVPGS